MAGRPIDLGWMRILLEIGRCGSLTAAAQQLRLTQPAVSYQIRRLEEELGTTLLKRQHRGVELTPEGRRLYDLVSRQVTEIDQLAGELRRQERPTIRLHTDYAFSSLWLIPRMQNFRALYPDINIQIVANQSPLRQNVEDDDVLVIFGNSADAGQDATLLLAEKVTPVCAPGFLDCPPDAVTTAQLAKFKLIHLDSPRTSNWFDWQSYFGEVGVTRGAETGKGDISFNTYSLVIQAALGEQGLAIGWSGLVDDLLKSGALVSVGQTIEAPDRGYWLVGSTERKAAAAKLVNWLLEQTR